MLAGALVVEGLFFAPQVQGPPFEQLQFVPLPQLLQLLLDCVFCSSSTGTWMVTPLSNMTSTEFLGTFTATTLPDPLGVFRNAPICGICRFA
jgi:hypothetical protein